ncbi:MAG TPA: hypothetical protein VE987_13805 [Polyangiaceae bacterium]|nr:hypothetical protein [Polyangiaceae bacterium]
MNSRIPWARIVELAVHIDREYAARGVIDADIALRLVRAVLQFQDQLVAGMVRPPRFGP